MSDACCAPVEVSTSEAPARLLAVREIQLAISAGVALIGGIAAELLGAPEPTVTLLFVLALVTGGLTFIPDAVRGLFRGMLGVGTLMAIAAVGATILGELGEAATLAFLFSISEALESYALTKTRRGLRALLDLVPGRATVLRNGVETTIDPDELRLGDRLIVRPGERLATDGLIRSGQSALDFSAITGESVPVERGPGDEVFAAAINGGAALEVEVTARTADNSLARIVQIVEEAQERKGRSQRLAERIARPLVPGVLLAAFGIAVVGSLLGDPTTWIERSLVVLVAAAPCAFAISVPVTVVAAIGAATRSGVLIKGGAALEALSGVRAVALDKTGTLTQNKPRVVEVVSAGKSSSSEVLGLAASLERRSEHPLAEAIIAASPDGPAADQVEAVPGHGLTGSLDGQSLRLGRPGYVEPGGISAEVERLQEAGSTVVLLETDGSLLGAIAVRDELRPEAPAAVARLERLGLRTAMLTGDNRRTAEALGAEVGVGSVHADLLPTDKVTAIEELQRQGATAMVGDGINDAPALASADVGIAMGAMGTDVAIEAADVALMGDDLRHLPDTLAHARRAGRIMRQNLLLSGGILVTLIPLAATGALGLAAVVAIHELAEVLVIANGVRAGRRGAFGTHDPSDLPVVEAIAVQPKIELPVVIAGNAPDGDGCGCGGDDRCQPTADLPGH
ncbi:MAG: cadmium-translocating P-type ATPase [Solirubrobacterales bacterium]|nr:cadmium-translocating P-type ATPase [Solirubrobacterales bacterium]